MPKETPAQREVIDRVMHEFKEGDLRNTGGKPVRDRRQAVAIALSEAGSSNRSTPARNRRALAHTRGRETRADLYRRAREKGIPGRSRMTKAQLQDALGHVA